MLGLEGYGSDDNSDTEPTPLPGPSSKAVTSSSSSSTKARSSKRLVFTIAKPSNASSDDDEHGERAAKRPRTDSKKKGAGSSSLLAMLPAPTKAATARPPERTLGSAAASGTGIQLLPSSPRDNDAVSVGKDKEEVSTTDDADAGGGGRTEAGSETRSASLLLPPPTVAKAKTKAKTAKSESQYTTTANDSSNSSSVPSVDFFSLGTSTTLRPPDKPPPGSNDRNPIGHSSSTSITSAPIVPTFEPPPPTPSDPYPGYYQLPSGQWAAYDPEFYKEHYESWYNLDSSGQKGFEGAEGEDTVEIDAQTQLDLARKEREDKKSLTANARSGPAAPNMNIKRPKIGSLARTRHQLSALLTDAYENREALEEKIAQGRRNRKEAGNKYGF